MEFQKWVIKMVLLLKSQGVHSPIKKDYIVVYKVDYILRYTFVCSMAESLKR